MKRLTKWKKKSSECWTQYKKLFIFQQWFQIYFGISRATNCVLLMRFSKKNIQINEISSKEKSKNSKIECAENIIHHYSVQCHWNRCFTHLHLKCLHFHIFMFLLVFGMFWFTFFLSVTYQTCFLVYENIVFPSEIKKKLLQSKFRKTK